MAVGEDKVIMGGDMIIVHSWYYVSTCDADIIKRAVTPENKTENDETSWDFWTWGEIFSRDKTMSLRE